jgi:hypothetical protein
VIVTAIGLMSWTQNSEMCFGVVPMVLPSAVTVCCKNGNAIVFLIRQFFYYTVQREFAVSVSLGRGYIGASTDTTQQSGQTPDKEVKIKKHYCLCQRLH